MRLIFSGDGSHTLFNEKLNEHYHSIHGAIQESKHVFIEAGLKQLMREFLHENPLKVLEIGLGTGLNAFLTFLEAEEQKIPVKYDAIEAYPLNAEIAGNLNYTELLNATNHKHVFEKIHACEANRVEVLSSFFTFYKIINTLDNCVFDKEAYDLIYFDAFGPSVQPEMWTEQVFLRLYDSLQANGYLVTYCAKGEVKRTLKKVGFTVESLQGPPGKREMVRAQKK